MQITIIHKKYVYGLLYWFRFMFEEFIYIIIYRDQYIMTLLLWGLLLCLIIYGIHYYLNEYDSVQNQTYDLVDLRMQKYKNEIEKLVLETKEKEKEKEKETETENAFELDENSNSDMMNDLMHYIENKNNIKNTI